MEDICTECKKFAEFFCSCDNSLKFCSKCHLFVHKNTQGNHDPINSDKIRKEINSKIQNLFELKSQVISKSYQLINIIQNIASKNIFFIEKRIDAYKKDLKNRIEKMLKEYESIEIQESDLKLFEQIVTKIFSFFKDNEIFDYEEKKLESFKFSKNIEEIQKQLQTNFNFLLEGHTSTVYTVAVTSDNKYVVSGSSDNTIII